MPTTPPQTITTDTIIDLVAHRYGLTREELLGKCRAGRYSEARGLAMLLLRSRLRCSYPELGKIFSRDHTTAIQACQRVAAAIERDPQLAVTYDALKEQLNGSTSAAA